MPVFNALQDTSVNRSIKKAIAPLAKSEGRIEKLELKSLDTAEKVEISKQEAPYFEGEEELQIVPSFRVRGIVTSFDRKNKTGRLSLDDDKRVFFELSLKKISGETELDAAIGAIIDSLKIKIPVYFQGEAVLDFSGNPKKLVVEKVDQEFTLLEASEET